MSDDRPVDPELAALGEIVRLAREDRRRGIRYWHDPQLAEDLRAFVKEIDARPRSGERRLPVAGRSRAAGPRRPVSDPSTEGPPPPSEPPASPIRYAPVVPPAAPAAAPTGAPSTARAAARSSPGPAAARSGARPHWGPAPEAVGRDPDWAESLHALGEEAGACTACGLCRTRTTVVFGTGSARVPLVFVGEAPGRDEDLQGIPFVGRAGQLLTKIIEAIGLRREEVYICNVLKCRPPENRNPAPDEIAACRRYLERQLEILRPKVICTLGLFASQLLLESAAPIGKLRGRILTNGDWRILPTYHPAALLRNPSLKATVWEDVQLLRRVLDE